MEWRFAAPSDIPTLAELNRQLIQDEGHRNPMTVAQLEERMRGWLLSGEYRAVLFYQENMLVAYALYCESDHEIYLRHFFVVRGRRREGIGRRAMDMLFHNIWPKDKRLTVSVLTSNAPAIGFWRAMGYRDYSLTLEIMPEDRRAAAPNPEHLKPTRVGRGNGPMSPEAVACRLRDLLIERFGSDVVAIWLYGASTFGHPAVDVDLHIVLKRQLTPDEWKAVAAIHDHLVEVSSFLHEDLDLWYILLSDAMGSTHPRHLAPWANGLVDEHWALHRAHWLAGRRKVIHGPDPAEIVQPPTWEQLESALRRELERPAPLDPSPYWVLQLARVWASLETRDVVRSKLDSAAWALERLPQQYHPIIQAAARFYRRSPEPNDARLIASDFPTFVEEIRRRVESIT